VIIASPLMSGCGLSHRCAENGCEVWVLKTGVLVSLITHKLNVTSNLHVFCCYGTRDMYMYTHTNTGVHAYTQELVSITNNYLLVTRVTYFHIHSTSTIDAQSFVAKQQTELCTDSCTEPATSYMCTCITRQSHP